MVNIRFSDLCSPFSPTKSPEQCHFERALATEKSFMNISFKANSLVDKAELMGVSHFCTETNFKFLLSPLGLG